MGIGIALAAGSAIAGAGGVAAGAGTIAGIAGSSLLTASAVMGGVGQIFSGMEQADAAKAQAASEAQAAEFRAIEAETIAERERTQAAIESAQRQRELSRMLAEQRARFGGAGVDPFSGSPLRIQEVTESEVLRQERQAGLFSSLSISALNRQASQDRLSGQAALRAGKSKARTALTSGFTSGLSTFSAINDLKKPAPKEGKK